MGAPRWLLEFEFEVLQLGERETFWKRPAIKAKTQTHEINEYSEDAFCYLLRHFFNTSKKILFFNSFYFKENKHLKN